MAAMGAVWQAVALGAAGLTVRDGQLSAHPMLPPSVKRVVFRVWYRGRRYRVEAVCGGHTVREEN